MRENDIIFDSYDKLIKSNQKVLLGVPFMNRCIDMLLINDDQFIAIEFKLNDWKRAIIQARDHLLGVDKSYICLPCTKRVTDSIVESLEKEGVGLLQYHPNEVKPLKVIIEATNSKYKWNSAVDWLKKTVEEHEQKEQKNE